jgi:hypothetical protein
MLLQEPSAVRYRAFGSQANILVGQLVKDVSDPPDWPGDISSSSKPYLYIRYRIVFAFRTADGSCNNIKTPSLGMSFRPQARFLQPDYGNGK